MKTTIQGIHKSTQSPGHIVLQYQVISDRHYIRVASTSSVDTFVSEVKRIYKLDDDSLNLESIPYVSDLHERLMNDLEYKKFRDVQLTRVVHGLWEVTSSLPVAEWYNSNFKPYIKNKLANYLEDLDEESILAIDPDSSQWKTFKSQDYVSVHYETVGVKPTEGDVVEQLKKYVDERACFPGQTARFKLRNIYKTSEGKYSLSKQHIYSIASVYAHNMYCPIAFTSYSPSDLDVRVEDRCLTIDKDVLEQADVEALLLKLQYTGSAILDDEKHSFMEYHNVQDFVSTLNADVFSESRTKVKDELAWIFRLKSEDEQDTTIMGTSTTEQSFYGFVGAYQSSPDILIEGCEYHNAFPGVSVQSNGDMPAFEMLHLWQPTRYGAIELKPPCSQHVSSTLEDSEVTRELASLSNTCSKPTEIHVRKVMYRNLLNDTVCAHSENITLLPEFEFLSDIHNVSPVTIRVLEHFEAVKPDAKVVQQLHDILAVLTQSFGLKLKQPSSECQMTQREATSEYVKTYQNNTTETLASTVIENVNSYLTDKKIHVNRNQIGTDLVELGVRKARKAKGYVYGIEDSKHSGLEQVKATFNMPDSKKVDMENFDLRSCPLTPASFDSMPFNLPAKYITSSYQS